MKKDQASPEEYDSQNFITNQPAETPSKSSDYYSIPQNLGQNQMLQQMSTAKFPLMTTLSLSAGSSKQANNPGYSHLVDELPPQPNPSPYLEEPAENSQFIQQKNIKFKISTDLENVQSNLNVLKGISQRSEIQNINQNTGPRAIEKRSRIWG